MLLIYNKKREIFFVFLLCAVFLRFDGFVISFIYAAKLQIISE